MRIVCADPLDAHNKVHMCIVNSILNLNLFPFACHSCHFFSVKQIRCKCHWWVHDDIRNKFHPINLAKVVAKVQQWDGREAVD